MEKRRKKILYVITKSNFGGAQRNVFELATHLPKDEYDVRVAFGGDGLLKQKIEGAGIRTHTIRSFERDINVLKEFRSFLELRSLMREFRPDIVHLHSSKAGGIGALAARLCGVPKIIFTAHGWPFFEDRNIVWKCAVWFLSWFTALLSHTVILVSEHDRQKTWMPFAQQKFITIHTGVGDIPFLEREKARALLLPEPVRANHKNDLWVISTGEHTKNKNLFMLLDAVNTYNKSHEQKIFLTLMGDGEDRVALEKAAVDSALDNQVFFMGFISDAPTYLRAFDIFVLPSRKEGMPYGLLEAGAAGLSVIASNVGGIPEVIHDKKNGLLINPHDVQTLTTAFDSLNSDAEKSVQYKSELTKTIRSDFGIAEMLTKTISLYK